MRCPATQAKPAPTTASGSLRVRTLFPAWLMAALLALVTIALYWPVTRSDFVNYDDPLYVTENPHVQAGLSREGLAWAFGRVHGEGTYWHPLTWVSHMVDCQLYGLKPWGHHLTSVLLHAANAVLVFLVFRRMTGAFWRCVLLAGVFAMHPLQVDSVAWVTERKNLLSAFFWLLTTWAYVRYVKGQPRVQDPDGTQPSTQARAIFIMFRAVSSAICSGPDVQAHFGHSSLCPIAPGLLAAATLAAFIPRLARSSIWRLLREKVPFFVLAAASSAITILAHQGLGMMDAASRLPWGMRLENALVSYGRYLAKTFWPCRLASSTPFLLPGRYGKWSCVG